MIVDGIKVKTIPRFPNYASSKDGQVWSKLRKDRLNRPVGNRWLKPAMRKGYLFVVLTNEKQKYNCSLHKIILETYVGSRSKNMGCRHLNGNALDNRLENLCWGTQSENIKDAVRHGTLVDNRGEKCGTSKLKEQDVRMVIYMYRTGLFTQTGIAKIYKVKQVAIFNIVNKKTWRHLWTA